MTTTASTSNNEMELEIRSIIQGSYNPTIIPKLEDYVIACCKGEVIYIFDAIRTLIKLYQLFPITNMNSSTGTSSTSGTDATTDGTTAGAGGSVGGSTTTVLKNKRYSIIGYCCLLALVEYPNSIDLLSLTYMIPSTITLKESCPYIYKCNDSLRLCNYNEFWKQYESLLKFTNDTIVMNFAKKSIIKLQCSILYVLSLSYKRVPISIVTTACNTTDIQSIETTSKQLSKTDTTLSFLDVIDTITTDFIIFKPTTDNTKRQRVYQEGVSFASISSLLQKMGQ